MSLDGDPSEAFIVGVPRSGTGILQNLMRLSPSIAWVTPATNAMTGFTAERGLPLDLGFLFTRPGDLLSRTVPDRWLPEFLQGPYDGTLEDDPHTPAGEGSRIWGWHVPDYDHHRLTADDVTDEARAFYPEVATFHRRHANASTFLSKRPANSLRVSFLDELFPEARFVHLTRDPTAVASSIYRRLQDLGNQWFAAEPPGWREQLSRPVPDRIAWQMRTILETLRGDAETRELGERFVEVGYEDLTERPQPTLEALYDRLGLGREQLAPLQPYVDQLENRNRGWDDSMPDEDRRKLEAAVEGLHEEDRVPEGAVRVEVEG